MTHIRNASVRPKPREPIAKIMRRLRRQLQDAGVKLRPKVLETKGQWARRRRGAVGLWKYHGRTKAAHGALDGLVEAGLGRWNYPPPGPKGGRPSARLEIIPGAPITKTPTNAPENRGIGDGGCGDGQETVLQGDKRPFGASPKPGTPITPHAGPVTGGFGSGDAGDEVVVEAAAAG